MAKKRYVKVKTGYVTIQFLLDDSTPDADITPMFNKNYKTKTQTIEHILDVMVKAAGLDQLQAPHYYHPDFKYYILNSDSFHDLMEQFNDAVNKET